MVEKQTKQSRTQNKNKNAESSLVRLSKIPLVQLSIYFSQCVYDKLKSSSKLLNGVFNQVEKLGTVAANNLKPLAIKFDQQINYLDSIGNTVIDKIESSVPSVTTFQPKTFYTNTVNRVLGFRKYFGNQVNIVRFFNLNKTISDGLKSIDKIVDDYLPRTEDEVAETQKNDVNDNLVAQTFGIFMKLRKRSIRRVQNIQRLIF